MPRLPTKAWRAFQQSRQSLLATQELPALIVASHFMKEILVLNNCSPEQITVLPYFPQWEGEEWTPPMAPKSILFVGRLRTAKGILELIELLARTHSDITMSVVGDGLKRQQAEETVQRLGLENRVTFHGWLIGSALKEAYRRNALVVVPSLWPEPFGIIGLEAATMCRPSIAFDVGGIGDWLKDSETGYLVKAGDLSADHGSEGE
jgi:glycosyltransferase involved in cell wall biosynthesis